MIRMKRLSSLMFLSLAGISLISCGKDKDEEIVKENLTIEHELEFGGVYFSITIEEFNELGFEYGDSVDITFSNGYEYLDLPYYSGYYVKAGEDELVAYPGYKAVKLTKNCGDDIWTIAGLDETDTATIKLNKKAKYKDVQESLNITYKDEREKYDSDEMFANFRCMTVGNLKEGRIYRSASPCDNKHKRAPYVDDLIEAAQVKYIMNLADTFEKIDGYIAEDDFDSPYFESLYKKNVLYYTEDKVIPLSMNMNYKSEEFGQKIATGFTLMSQNEGPYLIHCLEGKDRTGFVCMLVEALCGASYQEIIDDYMLTYYNYYGITKEKESKKYEIIKDMNIDSMLKFICGDDNMETSELENITSFTSYVNAYLIKCGMTQDDIDTFVNKLTN